MKCDCNPVIRYEVIKTLIKLGNYIKYDKYECVMFLDIFSENVIKLVSKLLSEGMQTKYY